MDCLTEDVVLRFVEGDLSGEELSGLEGHTRACARCEMLLAAGAAVVSEHGTRPTATTLTISDALPRGTLVGRYTVLTLVGHGGMGEVYAAYDPQLDRKVALKLLRTQRADTSRGEARLLREAQAIAQLSHPNVVTVYDVGTFDGRVFVAMEYVEGETLSSWLADRPRSRADILTVFLRAADGLAAAHAAGLVHRDFKPQNVLVGRDGSVRVTDFGLVRRLEAPEPAAEPAELCLDQAKDVSLTQTGELVGTPRYMAPEQFRRQPTDPRTDQFCFSVALYEALYDEHPFLGDTDAAQLMAQVTEGRVRPPSARATVPAWLRRIVLRGLAVSPSARWPSMAALTLALSRDPTRARRRAAVAGLALAGLLIAAAAAERAHRPASLCKAGPSHLAGVWPVSPSGDGADQSRRQAARRAFLATNWPNAGETWDRAVAGLDRYVGRWLASYRDACEATQLRGEQSTETLDLRMGCLDERRNALKALTDVLVTADSAAVDKAVDAVNGLPDLAPCSEPKLLRIAEEPLLSPDARARAHELRRQAAIARVANDTGRTREATNRVEGLLAEARQLGDQPLLAELLVLDGEIHLNSDIPELPAALLEEAFWVGMRARRDDVAAEAATLLIVWGVFEHRNADGERWAKLAEALLDRQGDDDSRTRAWLVQGRATLHEEDDLPLALRLVKQAIAIKRRVLPPDHPDIAASLMSEAETLHRMNDDAGALTFAVQAETIFVNAYGPNSPRLCWFWSNHGEYLLGLKRPEEAAALFRKVLATLPPSDPTSATFLAYPLTGLGRALLALGRGAEARPFLERALAIRERSERRPLELGETYFALAQSLQATGDHRRSATLAAQALAAYRDAPGLKDKARTVAAWIADNHLTPGAHPGPRPRLN
ncbi:MAG TPA: protein kinase [Polyangia bacterium]|nr:protein kinase [Polyangia bacterium]